MGYTITSAYGAGSFVIVHLLSAKKPRLSTPTSIHYGLDIKRQITPTLSARLGNLGWSAYNMTRRISANRRITQILPDGRKLMNSTVSEGRQLQLGMKLTF